VKKLGCIQIDTINVIERAHYITLWSRLGNYKKEYLNELAYKDRKLFEYEGHAVSYLPFQDYRYFIHSMKIRKKEIPLKYQKYGKRLLNANKLDNYFKPESRMRVPSLLRILKGQRGKVVGGIGSQQNLH
jgi:uncharacterized protein YcaQ